MMFNKPKVIEVAECDSFKKLPLSFDYIFKRSEKISMFFSKSWFLLLKKYVIDKDKKKTTKIFYVYVNNKPEMIFPLYMKKIGLFYTSYKLFSFSNYYSSLFSPMYINNEFFDEAFGEILKIIKIKKYAISQIILNPLDYDSEQFSGLVRGFEQHNYTCEKYFSFGNWFVNVEGISYQEYYETLPTVLQNTIKRKSKKIKTKYGFNIDIVKNNKDIYERINDFQLVYNSSWKITEPYPDFIEYLSISLSERDVSTRLGIISYNNIPIAAQLWFVCNGVASIFKLAYKKEYKKLSVGTVLTARMMEYVIDVDKVNIIDYLTGDDNYKKDWMSERRERWGIIAYNNRNILGRFESRKYFLRKLIKKITERV